MNVFDVPFVTVNNRAAAEGAEFVNAIVIAAVSVLPCPSDTSNVKLSVPVAVAFAL